MLIPSRTRNAAAAFCALSLLLAGRALAQESSPEDAEASDDDDLEIPATPAPSAPPGAPAPAAPDGRRPAAQAAPGAAAPPTTPEGVAPPPGEAPVEAAPAPAAPAEATSPAASPPPVVAPPPPTAVTPSPAPVSEPTPAPSEVAAEPSSSAPPARSRGLELVNLERTAHSRPVPLGLVFSGFVQAQLGFDRLSEDQLDPSGAPYNRDQFALRVARLRLDGGHEYTAYTLELDATTRDGAQVGVRRAEGSLLYRGPGPIDESSRGGVPLVALTVGVTDVPFGFELVESARTRPFMERSAASEALFPTQMDVGAKLHGAWSFLRYALALVNGEPVRPTEWPRDPNAAKDLVGRFGVEVGAGDALSLSGGTSFAFGKGFHAGPGAVKDTVAWRDDNNDGLATPNEIVGAPGTAALPSESFERWALGLDFQAQLRTPIGATRLFLEAVVAQNHDRGLYRSDPVATGFDLRQLGAYASLTQELGPYLLVGFRADYYDPNSDFFEERRGQLVPRSQSLLTLSPIVGFVLPERARLIAQYDFVRDELGRDAVGVPTDADNDRLTLRLQVDL